MSRFNLRPSRVNLRPSRLNLRPSRLNLRPSLRALQIIRGDVAQVVNLRSLDGEPEQSQINNLRYSSLKPRIHVALVPPFF